MEKDKQEFEMKQGMVAHLIKSKDETNKEQAERIEHLESKLDDLNRFVTSQRLDLDYTEEYTKMQMEKARAELERLDEASEDMDSDSQDLA